MRNVLTSLLLLVVSLSLFPEESEIISGLRKKIISSVELIKTQKDFLLEKESDDNTSDIELLISSGLHDIYYFDNKQIMYKELRLKDTELPIPIVHKDFLNLPIMKQTKIYLGDLFVYKGKVFYLIGIKNEKRYIMYLFELTCDDYEEKYALTNIKGEVFFNKGYTEKEVKTSLENKEKLLKFKFFPNHKIYYFIEE